MSASIVLVYPPTGFGDPLFAIVADETHFAYVFPPGQWNYLEQRQAAEVAREASTTEEWLEIAGANMSQMRFTESVSAENFDAGTEKVTRWFAYMDDGGAAQTDNEEQQ